MIISPHSLYDILAKESTVLFDATWFMPNVPRSAFAEYLQKRIPRAFFWDADRIASASPLGLKHMLPSKSTLDLAAKAFGAQKSSDIVVYDTLGVFSAPRTAYTFRAHGFNNVYVLDGGLPRWEAEGLPLERTEASPAVKATLAAYQALPLVDANAPQDNPNAVSYDYIVSNAKSQSPDLVLDARPSGRFSGKDPEPRAGLPSGHIPHSVSLPFVNVLTTSGTFKPKDELQSLFSSTFGPEVWRGVLDGSVPVITSCGSGMTAAVLWLALQIAGAPPPRLYDESWTGYAMRQESDIVTSHA